MRPKRLFLLATPLSLATVLRAPHPAPPPPPPRVTEVTYPAAAARDDRVINPESASSYTNSNAPGSNKDDDAWKAVDAEQLGVRVSSIGGALNRSATAGVSLKDLERGAVVLVGVVVAFGLVFLDAGVAGPYRLPQSSRSPARGTDD